LPASGCRKTIQTICVVLVVGLFGLGALFGVGFGLLLGAAVAIVIGVAVLRDPTLGDKLPPD